jgi:transcriptional regulator with XRE-family HTH domain
MPLGQRIRELREERDISLREFAKKLGYSAPFLSDIELGRRFPSEDTLKEIAHALRVNVDELKAYDTRPPIEAVKRATEQHPLYALAFRTVIDKKIPPEELLKFAQSRPPSKKKP